MGSIRRVHSQDSPYVDRGYQVDFNTLVKTPLKLALQSGSITVAQDTTAFRDADGIIPAGSLMSYNATNKNYEYYDGTLPATGILGKDTDVYDGDGNSFLYLGNIGIYTSVIANAAANGGLGIRDLGGKVIGDATFFQGIQTEFFTAESITADGALALDQPSDVNGSLAVLAVTLADGTYIGQRKIVTMSVDASNAVVLTIAHHETADAEEATFNALDEYLSLEWSGTEWATIKATCTFV